MYTTWEDLTALIPSEYAMDACDDDADGTAEMWPVVRAAAAQAVDTQLMARYDVPVLAEPLPVIVAECSLLEAAWLCYARRNQEENFPFKERRDAAFKTLALIAGGTLALYPTSETRATAAVITEPARSYPASGRLSA